MCDPNIRRCRYTEMPTYFTWNVAAKQWRQRKKGVSIGRIVTVSPSNAELYALKLLLLNVVAPQSFQHLRTVNNVVYPTFVETCIALGLLNNENGIEQCIQEELNRKNPNLSPYTT